MSPAKNDEPAYLQPDSTQSRLELRFSEIKLVLSLWKGKEREAVLFSG